jgi:Holliday junction resolvase
MKGNIIGIKTIQDLVRRGIKEINKSELTNLGFDTSLKEIVIRNIKIEKNNLLGTYNLSIINKYDDINGNPISENVSLIHRIHNLWEAGRKEINFSDLIDLNIFTPASEIKIGNIRLSNYLGIDESYDISLINNEKNIDNRWLDLAVKMSRVMDTLIKFPFDQKMLQLPEVPLNKVLEKYFKEHFESVKKSDTSNKGLIDLTIGNEKTKIAMELKLARKIKLASESQKCRGQIEDYKKQFGSNLILVIAGEKGDRQEKYLQECIKKSDSLGIKSFFLEAKE